MFPEILDKDNFQEICGNTVYLKITYEVSCIYSFYCDNYKSVQNKLIKYRSQT